LHGSGFYPEMTTKVSFLEQTKLFQKPSDPALEILSEEFLCSINYLKDFIAAM